MYIPHSFTCFSNVWTSAIDQRNYFLLTYIKKTDMLCYLLMLVAKWFLKFSTFYMPIKQRRLLPPRNLFLVMLGTLKVVCLVKVSLIFLPHLMVWRYCFLHPGKQSCKQASFFSSICNKCLNNKLVEHLEKCHSFFYFKYAFSTSFWQSKRMQLHKLSPCLLLTQLLICHRL